MNKGRKYEALIFSIAMWFILLACIMYLLIKEVAVPGAMSTSFIILTGVIPGYLTSNTVQKNAEINAGKKQEVI